MKWFRNRQPLRWVCSVLALYCYATADKFYHHAIFQGRKGGKSPPSSFFRRGKQTDSETNGKACTYNRLFSHPCTTSCPLLNPPVLSTPFLLCKRPDKHRLLLPSGYRNQGWFCTSSIPFCKYYPNFPRQFCPHEHRKPPPCYPRII